MKTLLIGGQALKNLGSTRHTDDLDFLVLREDQEGDFYHKDNVDYCNAAHNEFFKKVWEHEGNNNSGIASPQALLDLKVYSFEQHCLNMNFEKADTTEFDIKFLIRKFNVEPKLSKEFVGQETLNEIKKMVR